MLPEDAFTPVQVGDGLFFLAPVASDDGAVVPQLFRIALAGGERVQLTRRAGGFHALAQYWPAPSLGRLFFTVADAGESELWVSDGTAAGTGGFALAPDGAPLAGVREVAAGPGFAIAWTGQFGELERSVFGLALATRIATRLADMPVRDVYAPLEWASSPVGVVFAGNDPQHGEEPWISDGTLAGTRVLDVAPGPTSSRPHAFAGSDAGVFFAARTVETGEELWIANGIGAGARLVADLAPGRDSSSPSRLVAGPGRLLFAADDGASGNEPWILEWSTASAPATADGGVQ